MAVEGTPNSVTNGQNSIGSPGNSFLSFASTKTFRNLLVGKNLAAYKVVGVFSPSVGNLNYETILTDSPVIDSPDSYISEDPFAKKLYPLNQYGPEGGYNIDITYNGAPLPVNSNQGEYSPKDTKMDLLNEFFIDLSYNENVYGPTGGYQNMVTITDIQNNNKLYENYWGPPSFVPSTYTSSEIFNNKNPNGSDGTLSSDSFIAKLGGQYLQDLFKVRSDAELLRNNIGNNTLQLLKDPNQASLLATGKQPLIYKNWSITVPENQTTSQTNLKTRLNGEFYPTSPIPGDYFTPNLVLGASAIQGSLILNSLNQLTGGLISGALNTIRNPSQIFIANTGDGQKSSLFSNIDLNRYKPSLDRTVGGVVGSTLNVINTALKFLGDPTGGYYVGSANAEPSLITSPGNQIPTNIFGNQVASPVYGPTELSNLYEGNIGRLNFGLAGKSTTDGGGIGGQFVWVSPRYKNNAGFKPTIGGGAGSLDKEFNQISSDYLKSESVNVTFKSSSILDNTQRLIDSADNVNGITRLKHVGNAINQVSKVFNDGYKEITKGSKILKYKDNTTGLEKGFEYGRVFAKDTPYFTYADLQKTDGITTKNRRFTNSVLDNTYNLNIAPMNGEDSTNIVVNSKGQKSVKKYMFSIENLAWRTSSRDGFTYDQLPAEEKGQNGGRVMWFPPYDISFSENSNPSFTPTSFLGRPEPIYTYKETTRTGTLSWKIIVDHPSILNLIVKKQLQNADSERINSIVESFFAGCAKFDIIELAKRFPQVESKDLVTYQEILSKPGVKTEQITEIVKETKTEITTTEPKTNDSFNDYTSLGFYFDNNASDGNYLDLFNKYTGQSGTYETFSKNFIGFNQNTKSFFENIIINNFRQIDKTNGNKKNLMSDLESYLKSDKKGKVKITFVGSASALGDNAYNLKLSKKRVETIKQYFISSSKTFEESIADGSLEIIFNSNGESEKNVTPKGGGGDYGTDINCTDLQTPNEAKIYSVSAMACRRVVISEINVKDKSETKKTDSIVENLKNGIKKTIIPSKVIGITSKLKEGIAKKIIRGLLNEASYFQMIKEDSPMVYASIKEKIKHFNPAFHSMTPEGLNSRLTFLQQCVRPGDTIPVIGPDGKPKFNDALNTSFGTPPILVLRIGDFYNTKIVPTSLGITYDPLLFDLNPEGIGVQPMVAKITMGFNFIGGSGLQKPIEQLQNALSFNYYANTEIYDERAVPTEDTSAMDMEFFKSIVKGETKTDVNNLSSQINNNGGTTIGQILTTKSNSVGSNGDISYKNIMDLLLDDTKTYYTNVLNQLEIIVKTYNLDILQLFKGDRLFISGTVLTGGAKTKIFGKPDIKTKIDSLFTNVYDEIDKSNPIRIGILAKMPSIPPTSLKIIEDNMKTYIKDKVQNNFSNSIQQIIQNLSTQQESLVQDIRKINLISEKTDGIIIGGGNIRVYNLEGTNETTKPSTQADTLKELTDDFDKFGKNVLKFYDVNGLAIESDYLKITRKGNPPDFYSVIVQTFKNKKNEFRTNVLGIMLNDVKKYKKEIAAFDSSLNEVSKIYIDRFDYETKEYGKRKETVKKEFIDKIIENIYVKGKTRKFTYTTVPIGTDNEQKTKIKDLYATQNPNPDTTTFDGKIKFN